MKMLIYWKSNLKCFDIYRDYEFESNHRILWEKNNQNPELHLNNKISKQKIHKELFKTPEPLVPIEENLFYPEFNFDITNQSWRLMNLDFLEDKESSKENINDFHSFHIEENESIDHQQNKYPSFHDFESINYGIEEKLYSQEDSYDL